MNKQLTLFGTEIKENKKRIILITPVEFVCVKCGFCYEWFTVNKKLYDSHIRQKCKKWVCRKPECYSKRQSYSSGWNRGTAKTVIKQCFGCGKDITLLMHRVNENKTGLWSCNSRECKKAIQSELARIRWSNPEFKNKFVPYLKGTKQYLDKTCSHCGKQFKFEKYLLKRHISQRFYCSTSCSYADRNGHTNSNFGKKHPGINAGPRPKIMGRNNPMFGKITVRSCGYRKDLGHICRSSWEANYCRILKYLGVDYEYEPLTFEMTDTSYTPDIRTGNTFIEIKGYYKISFVLKHSNFTRLYPKINLVIINEKIYSHLARYYSRFIKNWEPDCFIK